MAITIHNHTLASLIQQGLWEIIHFNLLYESFVQIIGCFGA